MNADSNLHQKEHDMSEGAAVFIDPRNITVGVGRILYDTTRIPNGWVLPGGKRTDNRDEAWYAAAAIDRMARGGTVK